MNHTTEKESATRGALTPVQQAAKVMAFIESDTPDFLATAVLDSIDKAALELGIDPYREDRQTNIPKLTEEGLARLFERTRFYHPAD